MDCLFCKIVNNNISSYTVYENEYVKCFLDINPLSKAHTLIIPKKHFKDFQDIDINTLNEINKAAKIIMEAINKCFNPNGIKLVQNNGILQEIKHFHIHIIPSYSNNKDNNNINKTYEDLKELLNN